jgi:DNA-directed RNA polymerase specialized sigma24 family protein
VQRDGLRRQWSDAYAGFASEAFAPAFSLKTKRHTLKPRFQYTSTKHLSVMDTTQPAGNVATAHSSAGKPPTEEAERALLALISAGDRSAMDKLYVLYFARLAKFFLHLTAHADLVEELVNDTMVEVWREGASIGGNPSVAVWIMGLAYSHGKRRVAKVGALLRAQPSALHTEHDRPRSTTTLEASWCLDEFLLRLPVEERALLHLVYSGGHSRRDIADIMNISCECVDVLLSDIRLRRGYAQGYVAGNPSY